MPTIDDIDFDLLDQFQSDNIVAVYDNDLYEDYRFNIFSLYFNDIHIDAEKFDNPVNHYDKEKGLKQAVKEIIEQKTEFALVFIKYRNDKIVILNYNKYIDMGPYAFDLF
ncbi:hypothetical protein [Pelistega sp. MC2]|uniref:hypothetical protein n=1 Tax=Pelistega sp. MC2 TaxID=1720297 RepID=UPI0008DA317C|nr:hypothetical protein [Pelistega sp. MC2]